MLTSMNSVFRFIRRRRERASGLGLAIICVLGAVAVLNPPVHAQSPISGSFAGIVTDKATSAKISGATATFRNQETGSQTTAITGADGLFMKTSLSPGFYEIEVKAEGYLPEKKLQRLLATRENSVVPVPFELIRGTVSVAPAPTPLPLLSEIDPRAADEDQTILANPRRGGAFDIFALRTLPLGGTTLTRTFDELAFLVPGVYNPPQAIGSSVGPGVGSGVGTSGQFSVNGLRSRANNFMVDGSDNNDEDIGVRRQGFFTLVPQPIESIQEFQIITLLAPAEFGRNLGAQVNALSRSGANRFSGTIYGFGNADFFNARNFFDNTDGDSTAALQGRRIDGTTVPVFLNNQPLQVTNDAGEKDAFTLIQGGFAIGGPIKKNKVFFFVSGEGQYLNGERERHFAVPTVEERGILFSGAQGFTGEVGGGQFVPIRPTTFIGNAVFSLFPFANDPAGVYGANTYTKELSIDARGVILSGKVDWDAFTINGNQQRFTARYNFTDDRRDLTDVAGALFSAIRPLVRTDNISTYLTGGLSQNISNELRFSYGRTRLRFEELRDPSLLPISSLASGSDTRFLLNAPLIVNNTIGACPGNAFSCPQASIVFPGRVDYVRQPLDTEDSLLGPVGQIIIGGFSPVGVDVFNFPQQRENETYQFADTVRWQFNAAGQHSLALGTDIRRTYLRSDLPRNSRTLVTFFGGQCTNPATFCPRTAGFAQPLDFASAGAPTGFFQSLVQPERDASIDLSYNQLNFFVGDEWRPTSNFNLSFGLRYEVNTTPKEADRKIEDTFGTAFPSFLSGLGQFVDGRTSIYETDRNNFAPRLGFAYSPTGDTVIRGGFGIYYDQILGAVVSQSRNVFPTFTTVNFGGGAYQGESGTLSLFNPRDAAFDPVSGRVFNANTSSGGQPCAGCIPLIQPGTLNTINPALSSQQLQTALQTIFAAFPAGSLFGTTLPTRELDTPMSYQYSIGMEQRLFTDTFLSAAYVGTTGRNLLRFTTPNLGGNFVSRIDGFFFECPSSELPGAAGGSRGDCQPQAQGSTSAFAPRPVPNAGAINQFETTGESQYHSLQLEFRGRFSQNFQFRTNYVFGSVKDDVSDVFDLAGAFALPQNSLTLDGEYAPANFDVRHRFAYNFMYDAPGLKNSGAIVRTLLGGWQIASTGRFSSGQPFTVNSIVDINQDGNLTDRLNSLQFISEGDRTQPLVLAPNTVFREMLASFSENGAIPRNSFRTGSLIELDLAFAKRFRFTETQDLRFRVDVFNFINRANFGVPVRFLEAAGFGRVTETITPARRVQFGLHYSF